MPFEQLLENIKNTRAKLPEIFGEALLTSDDEIVRLNQSNLRKGMLSTGELITPEYSDSYAARKGFNIPDLNLTGGFYGSIFVTETNEPGEIWITSDEIRDGFALAAHLESVYSPDIYSITEEQLDKLFDGSTGDLIINSIENGFET